MKSLPPVSKLDYETPLYKGCGSTELFTTTLILGCLWLPVALIIGYSVLSGNHALFLAFAAFTLGTTFSVAALANFKNWFVSGKPENWHIQNLYCWIHPAFSSNLVYKSGCWSSVRRN